jgi:hypothetical protein
MGTEGGGDGGDVVVALDWLQIMDDFGCGMNAEYPSAMIAPAMTTQSTRICSFFLSW